MPKPSPKLDPATDAVLRRMLATPPQPSGVVKVGYQASDGPDRLSVKAA
jgi:hypothetical protein